MSKTAKIDWERAYDAYVEKNGKTSQKDFYEEAGTNPQNVWNMENGKTKNEILTVAKKVSELSGIPLDELIINI